MKAVLVTGGTGFLGRAIVNRLSQTNKVIIFDNDSRGSIKKIKKNSNIKFIRGDIRIKKDFQKIKFNISKIYHLAYVNGTGTFYKKPVEILDVAILGLYNLLDFAKNKEIKSIILASSSEVYQTPKIIPTSEDIELSIPSISNPRFSYGLGKIISEFYFYHYLKNLKNKINLKIFRPHNLFGPDMGNDHVIPQILRKVFLNKNKYKNKIQIKIQGSGNETRSFCYIDDAVEQILKIDTKGKNLNIYNVGQSDEITIKRLISDISTIVNKKISIKPSKVLLGSTPRRCPDMKKTFNLLKNKNNYLSGLTDTIQWYKKEYGRQK